jgi:hypothetical protein
MLWKIGAGLVMLWFFLTLVLHFVLHKGGYVHIILMGAIAVLVVHFIAYRKTQYQKTSAGRPD